MTRSGSATSVTAYSRDTALPGGSRAQASACHPQCRPARRAQHRDADFDVRPPPRHRRTGDQPPHRRRGDAGRRFGRRRHRARRPHPHVAGGPGVRPPTRGSCRGAVDLREPAAAHRNRCAARTRFPPRDRAGKAERGRPAALRRRHVAVHRDRRGGRGAGLRPCCHVRVRSGLCARPAARRCEARRTHWRAGAAQNAVQPMAPLRQDAALPRAPAGHRRRGLQLQSDLWPGHDGGRARGVGAA